MRLTFFFLLIFGLQLNAQNKAAIITTEDEYNYMTKGYPAQVIDQGGDIKKGYAMEDRGMDLKMKSYHFKMKNLVRTDSYDVCGLLLIVHSSVSGKTYYLGIPINNDFLLGQYYAQLELLDGVLSREIAKVTSLALANTTSTLYTVNNVLNKKK